MSFLITKLGSEYKAETVLPGTTLTVGFYNDDTDQITYQHDLANITTEPTDGNYAPQTFTAEKAEGTTKAKIRNAGSITFDLTNTTGSVNALYIKATFQSDFAGDGSPTEHLVATLQLRDADGPVTLDLSTETSWTIDAGLLAFES